MRKERNARCKSIAFAILAADLCAEKSHVINAMMSRLAQYDRTLCTHTILLICVGVVRTKTSVHSE